MKNAKNTHTKHRKHTAKHCFFKNRDPLREYVTPPVIRNLRVLRIVYFCDRFSLTGLKYFLSRIHRMRAIRIAAVMRRFYDFFEHFAFVVRCFAM